MFGTFGAQRLSHGDILKLVNRYIGVDGGYLGDFTRRSHAEFYPEYCGLEADPDKLEGTTRERFIQILSGLEGSDQAKVLRGVIERFPVGSASAPSTRTDDLKDELLAMANLLEGTVIPYAKPGIRSEVVLRALDDAETLLKNSGPVSAVDRIHTALQGYLRAACDNSGLTYRSDASMVALWKTLRDGHPRLNCLGPRGQEVERVLNACSSILDAASPIRNNASVAHPNSELLGRDEAMLIVNVGRALVGYFEAKFKAP